MKVDLDIDTRRLQANLQKVQRELPRDIKKALMQTAQFGTNVIMERTKQGIGYEGKFKPYSASYRAQKSKGWPASKAGAKIYRPEFGGDSSGVVNLSVTGKMLASIQSKYASKNVAEIYFSRATEAKKAAFNNDKRPFFGFNQSEKARLRKFFQGRLK